MNITDELAEAYLAAEYRVFTSAGTIVLPGRGYSAELSALHASYDVINSAFLTAYNPYSEKVDDDTNLENQARLILQVSKQWQYLQGEGVDPNGQWPAEPGILVLGIKLEDALELGASFQQHAIWFALNDRINLYACRPEDKKFFSEN